MSGSMPNRNKLSVQDERSASGSATPVPSEAKDSSAFFDYRDERAHLHVSKIYRLVHKVPFSADCYTG